MGLQKQNYQRKPNLAPPPEIQYLMYNNYLSNFKSNLWNTPLNQIFVYTLCVHFF